MYGNCTITGKVSQCNVMSKHSMIKEQKIETLTNEQNIPKC